MLGRVSVGISESVSVREGGSGSWSWSVNGSENVLYIIHISYNNDCKSKIRTYAFIQYFDIPLLKSNNLDA